MFRSLGALSGFYFYRRGRAFAVMNGGTATRPPPSLMLRPCQQRMLAESTEEVKIDSSPTVIGIDIGKNCVPPMKFVAMSSTGGTACISQNMRKGNRPTSAMFGWPRPGPH